MDISEALRQSEERYRALFEQSPVGVFIYDESLIVVRANECLAKIVRMDRTRIPGFDLRRVRDRSFIPALQRVFAGENGTYEGPYETTAGFHVVVSMRMTPLRDARGVVVAGMGVVEDVTERASMIAALRESEQRMARSEARFRSLIERAPDAVLVSRAGGCLYANPAVASYLGYAASSELEGRRLDTIVHADDLALLERQALATPVECRFLRADGTIATCEVVSMLVEYDGEPAVVTMARDLTERKLMQARLLQSDRMASVGQLAAGVAHEINNPLAYVKANVDVVALRRLPQLRARVRALEDEHPGAGLDLTKRLDEIADMIELAREGAERVRTIVRDLKTFSRADDASAGPTDVVRVLEASVNMAWNEIRHRATLEREYGELPPIVANESRLGQVFLNLLVNAAQAIPEGNVNENEIRLRAYEDAQKQRVVVSVSDTGTGIRRESIGRVFDPFFTTKPVGVGTGLGLWICQGIVASLGGEISVESTPPKGTTVTVSLPSHDASAKLSSYPPAEPSTPRRGRILLIDDEPALGASLSIALSDEHDVVSATSGRQALELLRHDDRFDLVLCDLMMPDVTGMEVYERLNAERPELAERMVFVTGGSFTRRSSEFLEVVAHRSLEKPFDLQKLRDLVRARL